MTVFIKYIIIEKEHGIMALFSNYTSRRRECSFYSSKYRSGCALDPLSVRVCDCENRWFVDGITCQYIVEMYKDGRKKGKIID